MKDKKLQVFQNNEFGDIRVIVDDSGNPLFCASDVCKALGYSSGRQTIQNLFGDGVYKLDTIDSLGRKQTSTFLNEPQVYRLIMRSNAKNAEKFQDWVCGEVLPSIRKNKMYIEGDMLQAMLSNPDTMIQILTNYKEEKQKRMEAERLAIEKQEQVKALTMLSVEKQSRLDSYAELEKDRRSKAQIKTDFNRAVRKLAIQRGIPHSNAYTIIYNIFSSKHLFNHKVDMKFLEKNINYLAECLGIALSELNKESL